jgi:hypothetical protein
MMAAMASTTTSIVVMRYATYARLTAVLVDSYIHRLEMLMHDCKID